MEIYLDHAATTWVYPEVAEFVTKIMCSEYGNPSSMHQKGLEAERIVKASAAKLAKILKVQEKEIFFTSGGTESNNWALAGAAKAWKRKGRRIITSAFEHASVSAPLQALEKEGFEIVRIGVDKNGQIDREALAAAVNDETVLVSLMMVNNEIGAVQDISALSRIVKGIRKEVLFHTDAIQAFGKYPLHPKQMGIDLMSVSGHKIHAPKGTGFLYVSGQCRILPLIYGGGQQNGMRSGTDNVPGIAGLAEAAEKMYDTLSENVEKMQALKRDLIAGISGIDGAVINSPLSGDAAPHILNVSFPGIRSEVMLHALEERGIYVSAGSACSSHKRAASATLTAIGCSKAGIESAVRFSFCEATQPEEIRETVRELAELVPALRRYTRH